MILTSLCKALVKFYQQQVAKIGIKACFYLMKITVNRSDSAKVELCKPTKVLQVVALPDDRMKNPPRRGPPEQ